MFKFEAWASMKTVIYNSKFLDFHSTHNEEIELSKQDDTPKSRKI